MGFGTALEAKLTGFRLANEQSQKRAFLTLQESRCFALTSIELLAGLLQENTLIHE